MGAAEDVGRYIAGLAKEQTRMKTTMLPEEVAQGLTLRPFDKVKAVESVTANKLYYPTDSFIVDHPVYGYVDSSTLKIDGGHATLGYVNGTQGYWPLDTALSSSSTALDEKEGGTANNLTMSITAAAYYPFDGNANDQSTSGNDGTVSGATLTYDHLENPANAYHFNGSSTCHIEVPHDSSLNVGTGDFSISAIIKLDEIGVGVQRIVDKRDSAGYSLSISNDGKILFEINDGGGLFQQSDDTVLETDLWYHIVVTADRDGNVTYYIDGVAKSTDDISTESGSLDDATTSLFIGNDAPSGSGVEFHGDISDVLIVKTLLSSASVARLYDILSSHKLNKPLVAMTDSDGDSITGYEMSSVLGTSADADKFSTQLVSASSVGLSQTGTWSVYTEVLINDYSGVTNASIWNASSSSSNRINLSLDSSNIGFQRYDTAYTGIKTSYTPYIGKIMKILCINNGGTLGLYINGSSVGSSDNNYAAIASGGLMRIGYPSVTTNNSKGISGVVGQTLIWNRVLSSDERSGLFNGTYPKESITVTLR